MYDTLHSNVTKTLSNSLAEVAYSHDPYRLAHVLKRLEDYVHSYRIDTEELINELEGLDNE